MDSFEKESKLSERRAARQRQMRLMEEAAAGVDVLPSTPPAMGGEAGDGAVSADDVTGVGGIGGVGRFDFGGLGGGPPTIADIEGSQRASYSIDDDLDDEDEGPPSVFTSKRPPAAGAGGGGSFASVAPVRAPGGSSSAALRASSLLWDPRGSGAASRSPFALDEEKLGFITGSGGGGGGGVGGDGPDRTTNLARKLTLRDHDDGRDLIAEASRRLSDDEEDGGMERGGKATLFRTGAVRLLPGWCMLHRRVVAASIMVMVLFALMATVAEYNRKHNASRRGRGGDDGGRPPWDLPEVGEPLQSGPQNAPPSPADRARFDRIKDRLLEHGVTRAVNLEDPHTPQHKALSWIAYDDERKLDLPARDDEGAYVTGEDVDAERSLFNRYALAVLWYQTTDLRIVQESMTGREVENPFENPFDPLELKEGDIQWTRRTNWMTGKGLCLWQGVTCHPHDDYGEKYDGDFYVAILNLTDSNVHGIVPREVFTGLEKMKALDLSKNEFEGTIGEELGRLKDLEDLFLFDNNFSGILPDEFSNLVNLYNLYINDNKFRGMIPPDIGDLVKLRGVSMFNNTFEGPIPDSIGNLKDVIAFYLDENELTGQIPTTIGDMTSLIDVRLRDNKLSGSIPTELGNLNDLETIYLDTNAEITGPIPSELAQLRKLTELQLYDMDLKGSLPPELAILDELLYLYVDNNDLTGTIPEDWGQLPNLEQLFLAGNRLRGPLPSTLRGWTSLQMFRAADNELSGPIPSDLGKLVKLEYIYLESNDFSGNVPSELAELTKLKLLHLHDNRFYGDMSDEICNLKDQFALQELTADCEWVDCECCVCKDEN